MYYILKKECIYHSNEYIINNINIWDHKWQFIQYVYIKKHFYSTPVRKEVDFIRDGDHYALFSIDEVSNNVWEIFVLSESCTDDAGNRLKPFS